MVSDKLHRINEAGINKKMEKNGKIFLNKQFRWNGVGQQV